MDQASELDHEDFLRRFFLTLLLGGIFDRSMPASLAIPYTVVFFATLCILIVSSAARVLVGIFAESRVRLLELLITFFASGIATFALQAAWEGYLEGRTDAGRQRMLATFFLICAFWFLVGSAWAWSVCRRLNAEDGWIRLKYMAYGWLLVFGVLGSLSGGIILIGLFVTGQQMENVRLFAWNSLFAALAAIPGLLTQWRMRLLNASKSTA